MNYNLVDLIIPNSGDTTTISAYISRLVNLGYPRRCAISSLGGISDRSAVIHNGYVTRR